MPQSNKFRKRAHDYVDVRGDTPMAGKLLQFSRNVDDKSAPPAEPSLAERRGTEAVRREPVLGGSASRGARRHLLSVARGRSQEDDRASEPRDGSPNAADAGGDLTAAELVVWLESLRRGGLASVYWNAAKVPIDRAVMRAARLHEESVVNLCGQKVLVVEILYRRIPATAGTDDALAD